MCKKGERQVKNKRTKPKKQQKVRMGGGFTWGILEIAWKREEMLGNLCSQAVMIEGRKEVVKEDK